MLKKERAEYVSKRLDELYPDPPIPLDHTNSFTLLVAVVLSAQCTDKKVNEVTPALFARASGPQSMSKLPVSKVQSLIQTLGLASTQVTFREPLKNSKRYPVSGTKPPAW